MEANSEKRIRFDVLKLNLCQIDAEMLRTQFIEWLPDMDTSDHTEINSLLFGNGGIISQICGKVKNSPNPLE